MSKRFDRDALLEMAHKDVKARYQAMFGEPPRSPNKVWMVNQMEEEHARRKAAKNAAALAAGAAGGGGGARGPAGAPRSRKRRSWTQRSSGPTPRGGRPKTRVVRPRPPSRQRRTSA